MANPLSTKRIHIEKANANMAIAVAVAAFVLVFSLFACRALLSKRSYQNRVIAAKQQALDQLKANNTAASELVDHYRVFISTPDNIIGGSTAGKGEKDGDNAQIVLDALPSKYDYPALLSSLDKLISGKGKIDTITGTDDEVNQEKNTKTEPVAMPYEMIVKGSFKNLEGILKLMEQSIRPFEAVKITIVGDSNELTTTLSGQSYYQPAKSLDITTKVVE